MKVDCLILNIRNLEITDDLFYFFDIDTLGANYLRYKSSKKQKKARSSVVECFLDAEEVEGSIPSAPTISKE